MNNRRNTQARQPAQMLYPPANRATYARVDKPALVRTRATTHRVDYEKLPGPPPRCRRRED